MRSLAALHGRRPTGGRTGVIALLRAGAAGAALATCAAAGSTVIGGDAASATLAAVVAVAGVATGQLLGRRGHATAEASRKLVLRVADELLQYRAFTKLLRDQGGRIVASTSEAAATIIGCLTQMDAAAEQLRTLADRAAASDAEQLRLLITAIGVPVSEMLGQLQFQDITQQQIAFLSRLSLILDDHMVQLADLLGDCGTSQRLGRFRETFEAALDHCVMDGQRDDHHAASGLALREDANRRVELF